jgi:hypothetical protein
MMFASKLIKNLYTDEVRDLSVEELKVREYLFQKRNKISFQPLKHTGFARLDGMKFIYCVVPKIGNVLGNGFIMGINNKYLYVKQLNSIHSYMKSLLDMNVRSDDLYDLESKNHNKSIDNLHSEIEKVRKIWAKNAAENTAGTALEKNMKEMKSMGYKYYYYIESAKEV